METRMDGDPRLRKCTFFKVSLRNDELHSITFIKKPSAVAKLWVAAPCSSKSNYMFYYSQNKFTSRGGTWPLVVPGKKWVYVPPARCWTTELCFKPGASTPSSITIEIQRGRVSERVEVRSRKWGNRFVWGQQRLTQVEAVDAQRRICGIVQSSLLSPAASGVCVHLPRRHTWTTTAISVTAVLEQLHLSLKLW